MEQVFVGREAALAALAVAVSAAVDGRASTWWVEGDAGFGKSALVRQVIAALPDDVVVLTSEADELARERRFAVPIQLGAAATSDSFGVGLELLRLIGDCASDAPVLVVVEDLHWADSGSREALLTMARRLERDRVCLVVTSRPGGPADGWERLRLDVDRCRTVELGPLSASEVGRWAALLGKAMTDGQAERLHRHTSGHPLHVRTLLAEMTPEQLGSTGDLPAPRSLASTTVATLAELPSEAIQLASALAVLGQSAPLSVIAAVAGVTGPAVALESLLETNFVRWSPTDERTPVDFTHPLYRQAVYEDLSPTTRQRLHRAAAHQFGQAAGWPHRVAAADVADDDLADELEAGADDEYARGASSLAAKYLLWSAQLTSRRAAGEARMLRAARLLVADGALEQLADLLPSVQACDPGPVRDLVLGSYAYETGDTATAQRLLEAAASDRALVDASVLAELNVRLSSIYLMQREPRRQAETASAALSSPMSDEASARAAWRSLASAEFSLNGALAGLAVLDRRLPEAAGDVDVPDAELLMVRGLLKLYAAQTRPGIVDLRAAIDMSRAGFSHQHLPAAHIYLARALYVTGDWDEALMHARAAQAIVADDRHRWIRGRAEFVLGTIAASRGQWDDAAALLSVAETSAVAGMDTTWPELLGQVLRSAISRARGDATGVVAALRPLATDTRMVISQMAVVSWWPIYVEALIDSSEIATAAEELARLQRHVDETGMAIQGQLAGLRARLAAASNAPDEAIEWYEQALATIRPDDPLIERGLLHHRYGALLHARGNRRDAVDHLRQAHELFATVGAEPYRRGVADELESCGIRAAPASRSPLNLTEREQDVVALVRKGLTNREIAGEMYVSEKAIEYHLRNVYGKLGIASRRELRALDDR